MEGGRRRLATGVLALVVAVALVGPLVASGLVLADDDRGHGNDCDGADGDNPGAADGGRVAGVESHDDGRADERGGSHPRRGCDDPGESGATAHGMPGPTPTATATAPQTPTPTPTDRSTQGAPGGQSASTATPAQTPTASPAAGTPQSPDDQPETPTETSIRPTPQPTAPPSVPPGAAPGNEQPDLGGEAPPLPMVEDVPGLTSPADVRHSMADVAAYSLASAGIVGLATGLGWLFVRP